MSSKRFWTGGTLLLVVVVAACGDAATGVAPENVVPTIEAISDQTVLLNTLNPRPVVISLEITDPDDSQFSVSVRSSDSAVLTPIDLPCGLTPCSLTLQPVADQTGQVTVDITVVDGRGGEAQTSFVVHLAARVVTTVADAGAGSLRQVIADAEPGDVIGFDTHGVFATAQTIALATQLELDKSLTVEGPEAAPPTVSGEDAVRVFVVRPNAHVTLRRMVVTGGNSGMGIGGGVLAEVGSGLTLIEAAVTGNRAEGSGGGVAAYGQLTLRLCVVDSNRSERLGGGVLIGSSADDVSIEQSLIFDNTALSGGGIYVSPSTNPVLRSVRLMGNESLTGTTSGGGGGMFVSDASPTLTDVFFRDNSAVRGGGGMRISGGDATLTNVTFNQNQADTWGGGIFLEDAVLSLTNGMFYLNESSRGGGMYNFTGSDSDLVNVTFHANHATADGGGLRTTSGSSTTLVNSIVWGNTTDGNGAQVAQEGDAVAVLDYSLYGDAQGDLVRGTSFSVTRSLTLDPQFVGMGDLRLRAGSPAVDAGNPSSDLDLFPRDENSVPIDLDRLPRVVDGRIDMGAYENQRN